jgi:hypothetical protein
MSHIAKITIKVKDLEALKIAAKNLGLEFVENQKKYRWYGVSVGDYPLPKNFTASDLGKCEHALRIPNNSTAYEIGVVKSRDGDGYELLWDFYNGGYGLQAKVGANGDRIKQEYSSAVSTRQLRKQGYRVQRTVKEDGRVILMATK